MAINKNFVVKNGLEVSTDLIFADSTLNKVGIGSTIPRTELDVRGGIAATDLNVTGVATIATLKATTIDNVNLDATNINVTGIATIADLNATGISTLANVDINAGDIEVTSVRTSNLNATGVSTIASLSVTGSTFDTLTVNNFSNLSGITTIDNAIVTNLDVTGIATLGTVQVSSGIITAASGIVTYYGDGAYLQNISAGIGIGTTGGLVGYAATFINFYGSGVSTAQYDNTTGIATIFFEGGGSGTIGIGTEFPPLNNSNGDLFYNAEYARIFVYYDENIIGVGTDAYWVDAAPFNVGIITSLSNVALSPGSANVPSMYFLGDTQTGFFSPTTGETTFVSAGSSILNINPSGINVTGVITATTARIGAATTFTEDLVVQGDARVTGILTIGTASLTIDSIGNINSTGILTTSSANFNSIVVGSAVTINSTGVYTIAGIVTAFDFDSLSDINYKENVETVDNALDIVSDLRGVKFDWKETKQPSYGVIAQELEEVLPELVRGDNPKVVNYNGIIGVLIEAIKELKQEIQDLKDF